ncbi:MAG: flagellar biosynthesis protein FliQ [Verrucomicrobia bacterium]|nr:flagellar biosynthesis protein FliQ [Verrucomicrobiota bacterium]MCF7707908.1 flagellar biosynthesis protein FliQ [Verrucomicrobiota bacterium]
MNPEFAADILKMMMFQAVMLAAPILLTGMMIGLCVSLFQAVTSIQEQTLSFVPKALGVVVVLLLLMPWLLKNVIDFATEVIQKMPQMVG